MFAVLEKMMDKSKRGNIILVKLDKGLEKSENMNGQMDDHMNKQELNHWLHSRKWKRVLLISEFVYVVILMLTLVFNFSVFTCGSFISETAKSGAFCDGFRQSGNNLRFSRMESLL